MILKKEASPIVSIIAALTEDSVIGRDGQLPWKIKKDLQKFKMITTGHPIIMGRKTYDSIGRALPNRLNIVITRNTDFEAENCEVVNSLEKALELASQHDSKEIFIIGGGEIYRQALSIADKLYLTVVHQEFEGDTLFPEWKSFTKTISKEDYSEDGIDFTFLELER